jgi:hypothetical protein
MASVPGDLIDMLDPLVSFTEGIDLFEGPPPELPDNVAVLTHYAGEPALDRVMGASLTVPGVEVAMVQLFVRNTVMATAKTNADAIHALLDSYDGTINSRRYYNIESTDSMPFNLGQDGAGRWRMVCNFRVEHARS